MSKFRFFIDREYRIWERAHYSIEAETFEDAREIMLRELIGESNIEPDEYESLTDTQERTSAPEELYFVNNITQMLIAQH